MNSTSITSTQIATTTTSILTSSTLLPSITNLPPNDPPNTALPGFYYVLIVLGSIIGVTLLVGCIGLCCNLTYKTRKRNREEYNLNNINSFAWQNGNHRYYNY